MSVTRIETLLEGPGVAGAAPRLPGRRPLPRLPPPPRLGGPPAGGDLRRPLPPRRAHPAVRDHPRRDRADPSWSGPGPRWKPGPSGSGRWRSAWPTRSAIRCSESPPPSMPSGPASGSAPVPALPRGTGEQVERLSRLMRDLLEYGKPARTERVPGDLARAVTQALGGCRPVAEQHGVRLARTGPGNRPGRPDGCRTAPATAAEPGGERGCSTPRRTARCWWRWRRAGRR